MAKLYERCPVCRGGEVEPALLLSNGKCPGCEGRAYCEIGLTVAQLERIREALEESVKLQSHYAVILNGYDAGERLQFGSAEEWLSRLAWCRRQKTPAEDN